MHKTGKGGDFARRGSLLQEDHGAGRRLELVSPDLAPVPDRALFAVDAGRWVIRLWGGSAGRFALPILAEFWTGRANRSR